MPSTNAAIASKLRQAAGILLSQEADPFRIAAYRRAADALLARPLEVSYRDLGSFSSERP